MTNALRDENRVTTTIGVDKDDETLTTNFKINPATGKLLIAQFNNPARVITKSTKILRDENRITVACGISTDDPNVILPIAVSPEGYLLIE